MAKDYFLVALHNPNSIYFAEKFLSHGMNVFFYPPSCDFNTRENPEKHGAINGVNALIGWIIMTYQQIEKKQQSTERFNLVLVFDFNFGFSGHDVYIGNKIKNELTKVNISNDSIYLSGSGGSPRSHNTFLSAGKEIFFIDRTSAEIEAKKNWTLLNLGELHKRIKSVSPASSDKKNINTNPGEHFVFPHTPKITQDPSAKIKTISENAINKPIQLLTPRLADNIKEKPLSFSFCLLICFFCGTNKEREEN